MLPKYQLVIQMAAPSRLKSFSCHHHVFLAILVVLLLCLDGHVIHLGALAPQLGPSFRSSWTTLGQALGESGGSFWEPWGSLGRALGEPWGRLGLFCAGLNVAVYPHSGVHFTTSKKVDKKWKPRCACKGKSFAIVFTLFWGSCC